ncbi:MAG: peptide ABC transporter substrate-binding protein, partial [Candidatus Rokubacteria bacterium GWC2_70_16]
MDERALRDLISEVKAGRLSRRRFIHAMVGLGLTAPLAVQLLASAGVARAQTGTAAFAPTRRGGGGPLRTLWWQAPTLLNPHFANGTKDQDASRIFYEPLAAFDPDGNVVPILAAEVPSTAAGTLAKDLTWVTWRLKRGVSWHDGKPFTAEDVVFNWEYVSDPATAAVTSGSYREIARIETLDSHTVKVVFKGPQPFWSDAFCGNRGMIIPKHLFGPYKGGKSREAPGNLKPVGTGAYRFVDFKPGDVVRAELNPAYHVQNRPFFDALEMKGGGDAASAARAVLQTGEYDYAWNMQVEDEILRRLEQGGKGRVNIWPTGNPEHIQCNFSDPWTEVEGERASAKTTHPLLSDPAVRQALNLLVDRAAVQEEIYGRQGQTSANFLNAPSRFYSKNTRWEFSVDKANQLLDAAGWKRGADGIRAKDGKRLKMLYQTSINAPRQKNQQIVKQAAAKTGIDLELKSVVASVFFSSDPANPDTFPHFYADLQMYNTTMTAPDPQYFMNQFCSWEIAAKANKWQGRNVTRFRSDEYDRTYKAADSELDPVKR